jgi:hypothetical protein
LGILFIRFHDTFEVPQKKGLRLSIDEKYLKLKRQMDDTFNDFVI